ncbi:MAG: segregation/condensation protein A, partial [Holdemanella sp.]|nr:segregation/condensation protein A [Holdemanella sp.]
MEFTITIDQFEGPLDLMLHLIKENKLDLFDLDINVLCDQYMAFIHAMQKMHLEIASEYLAELASLIEYKSKKLLPREKVEVEEEYEEDKRDRLVQRLIEYQQYKDATGFLKQEFETRQKRLSPPQSTLVSKWQNEVIGDTLDNQSAYELMKAMKRVIS